MLDMIGVGPFITLPLLLAAMGGPQAMLGWILGALLALCDGLVWAELGAAMPDAGGTYQYLRRIYPGQTGGLLAFIFVLQLTVSAPLSVASGSIGLAQYASYLSPVFATQTAHVLSAVAAVLLAVFLLYRNLASLKAIAYTLWTTVLLTIIWILLTAIVHGRLAQAFTFSHGAFRPDHAFFAGLASAMLIATYDFWGYYNVAFLGGEVRDPARTIPRAILGSILIVAVLYLALNIAVLAVLPWHPLVADVDPGARRAVISVFMAEAYGARFGPLLGKTAAILIMVAAFASVFSLLLGYSRIPYAAARDGNFFSPFARLHPTRHFPYISLLYLGGAATLCCFLPLTDVIAALVVLRILLQFLLQHIGVIYLRRTQPTLPRPFRLWLYPLPPLLALTGFVYILLARPHILRELLLAAAVAGVGTVIFFIRRNSAGV